VPSATAPQLAARLVTSFQAASDAAGYDRTNPRKLIQLVAWRLAVGRQTAAGWRTGGRPRAARGAPKHPAMTKRTRQGARDQQVGCSGQRSMRNGPGAVRERRSSAVGSQAGGGMMGLGAANAGWCAPPATASPTRAPDDREGPRAPVRLKMRGGPRMIGAARGGGA